MPRCDSCKRTRPFSDWDFHAKCPHCRPCTELRRCSVCELWPQDSWDSLRVWVIDQLLLRPPSTSSTAPPAKKKKGNSTIDIAAIPSTRLMASPNLIKDMEENFFMCSVCLDQFKEPKQLPCLHRYCRECLKTVIQASHDGKIKCPMCKQEYIIPENGVDDFKTDFHMKSMLEFIQFQKSFENKDVKNCVGCSKITKVSAYCFKCRQFLCDQCYKYHINNILFTDHQPHTLKLDNIEAKSLTLDKLATLTEDPRCHTHVKQPAQLCCSTCGNVPVCLVCTYSKHKGHDLHDVTELAKRERELLTPKLAELNKYKRNLYELPKKIKTATQKLNGNVARKTEILINQHRQQAIKIKDTLTKRKNIREGGFTDIKIRRADEISEININLEEELKEVREMYDDIMIKTEGKYDDESKEFKEQCDEIDGELFRKLESLDGNLKNLTTAKELLTEQNENELKEIADYCEQIIKRYENFTATTSSILASKDEWTDAQCIPDIRAASEPLIEEMKKDFPELESLSDFIISDITTVIVGDVTITEHEESVVDVEGIKAKGWWINSVTSSRDGNIVITGNASHDYSHITVINRKGEIQRQDQIKREKEYPLPPERFCSLSEFKVITVCVPDEIGIYDVRDGTYKKTKIGDVVSSWSKGIFVQCVATDPANNHIIFGTMSRYVYVFDDQLNYSHTIALPDVISWSADIIVHRGSLLVCEYSTMKAYAVTIDGSESKLMYSLTTPDLDGGKWKPSSVCTDKNGFIYMLWGTHISDQWRCILVQYGQDGRQLLTTRSVDNNSRCVTTLTINQAEKLIILSKRSGKMYTYGLVLT